MEKHVTAVEKELSRKTNISTGCNENGVSFKIHYNLKIQVWHKAWNDFAGKRKEEIPITLFADPNDTLQLL